MMITQAPPTHPKICNVCGGRVVETTNDKIYGRKYGNGKCFLCTQCGRYVGCHNTGEALGVLSGKTEKRLKMMCHERFDRVWKSKKMRRGDEYLRLAELLGIDPRLCHFGFFQEADLREAAAAMKPDDWYLEVSR